MAEVEAAETLTFSLPVPVPILVGKTQFDRKRQVKQWIASTSEAAEDDLIQFMNEYVLYQCVTIWQNQRYDGISCDLAGNVNKGLVWCSSLSSLTSVIQHHSKRIVASMLRRNHFAKLKESQDKSKEVSQIATDWALHVIMRIRFGVADYMSRNEQNPLCYLCANIPTKFISSYEISTKISMTLCNILNIIVENANMRKGVGKVLIDESK